MQKTEVYDEHCSHCIHNPKATKPYDKMKRVSLGPEVTGELEKQGLNPSCYMCHAAHEIIAAFKRIPA